MPMKLKVIVLTSILFFNLKLLFREIARWGNSAGAGAGKVGIASLD